MWLIALIACRPYQPPAAPPALVQAASVRVVPAEGLRIAVRAGSAFDPSGREGLAWVAARIVAARIGAEVEVGREVVTLRLRGGTDGVSRMFAPVTEAELAAAAQRPERDCVGQAEDAYASWAWAGHPYGHPVWGRSSTLPTLRAVEVDNFLARWWVRSAMLSSAEIGALTKASPRLVRAPAPAFPPLPPADPVLRVQGVGSCAAVGGTGNVDVSAAWSLFSTAPPPVQSEGMYVATMPLPDGAAGEARLRAELAAWADGAPPAITPFPADWAAPLIPPRLRKVAAEPGPPAAALAKWMGGDRLRMVVVLPDSGAVSWADLVR